MKNRKRISLSILLGALMAILPGCSKQEIPVTEPIVFEGAYKVNVTGYADHLMEPFISRDGNTLMFNNSNDATANTNLHWATKIDEVTFQYKGEVTGVNTASLDGVPTMDENGILYFVSTRDYTATLSTIYESNFLNGVASHVALTKGVSKNQAGWVNFDVEVTANGELLYFVDGRFDQAGGPYESDIVIAQKTNTAFQRLSNSNEILEHVNSDELEYAACISANNLELYFTRVALPLSSTSTPQIYVSGRNNANEPFGLPNKIESITGFVEAATISPDGNNLYYHKKEAGGMFGLYLTKRVR